jgi:BirA family transcriptional regulator, biotin operon repressor / biotin---[acetyl-CoA-carboxylase] ligase
MWNIIEFDKVGSTNEIAAEMLARGEAHHGDVVQARHQSAGRGRGAGRVWSDEAGSSLLMSIILDRIPEPPNLLQYRAALAILDALRKIAEERGNSPADIILKWPNDILIRRKKVCGILLEAQWNASAMRSAVIGIGVNVKQKSFSEELAAIATSLSQCEIVAEVNEVRDRILNVIESEFYTDDFNAENQNSILDHLHVELEWMSELKSLALTNVDGSVLTGLNFAGIDDSGALNLTRSDGSVMVVHSGSLSWNV